MLQNGKAASKPFLGILFPRGGGHILTHIHIYIYILINAPKRQTGIQTFFAHLMPAGGMKYTHT